MSEDYIDSKYIKEWLSKFEADEIYDHLKSIGEKIRCLNKIILSVKALLSNDPFFVDLRISPPLQQKDQNIRFGRNITGFKYEN